MRVAKRSPTDPSVRLEQRRVAASIFFCLVGLSAPAHAQQHCDALASKLFRKPIEQALRQADCSLLGKAGLDHNDHTLTGVCYSSSGASSRLDLDVSLTCKTSDAAFVKASVSEKVRVSTTVVAADCSVSALDISAPGELGKALLQFFNVKGIAFGALQKQLNVICAQ